MVNATSLSRITFFECCVHPVVLVSVSKLGFTAIHTVQTQTIKVVMNVTNDMFDMVSITRYCRCTS